MKVTIQVLGAADDTKTPHDGRYVVAWTPHTRYGTLACTTTQDRAQASRFTKAEAYMRWRTISMRDPVRPDGKPNRPLAALNCVFEEIDST